MAGRAGWSAEASCDSHLRQQADAHLGPLLRAMGLGETCVTTHEEVQSDCS